MSLLYLIWVSALAIGLASVLVFLILIVRRYRAEKNARIKNLRMKMTQRQVFKLLEMNDDEFEKALSKADYFSAVQIEYLSTLCIRLCQILKGHDKEQVIRLLLKSGFDQHSLTELREGSENDRHAAAIALQYFHDRSSRQALLKALDDPSTEVSFAAANSLLIRNELPALDVLLENLQNRKILSSVECASLFRQIALHQPVLLIRATKTAANNEDLKKLLADSMGYASSFDVLKSLLFLCQDNSVKVRIGALNALGRLEHPDAESAILKCLDDADWEVQNAAVRAAGEIPIKRALPKLQQLLESENWLLRFNVAECLYKLSQEGRAYLQQRAQHEDRAGRMANLVMDEKSKFLMLST